MKVTIMLLVLALPKMYVEVAQSDLYLFPEKNPAGEENDPTNKCKIAD